MLHLCGGDQPVLPKQAVQSATRSLLNTMGVDDVISDAPNAADWVRRFAEAQTEQMRQQIAQLQVGMTRWGLDQSLCVCVCVLCVLV